MTTTPLQALALFNDRLVLDLADTFAQRVRTEVGEDASRQITRAWRLALGREPDIEERRLATDLAARHGLEAVCRGLLNLTEFVAVD